MVWELINVVQFVSYLPLMKVQLPYNIQKLYEKNTEFSNFQIIPTDWLTYITYGLQEKDKVPYSSNFALAGHEASLFILSIETTWYILYILFLVMLLKLLCMKKPRVFQTLHKLVSSNTLIRFHMQTFYILCLCSLVNLATADW